MRQEAQDWKARCDQLTLELDNAKQQLADADEAAALALERQVATAVERVRSELTEQVRKLELQLQELKNTSQELDAARVRLAAELDHANKSMADTDEAAAMALDVQVTTAVQRAQAEFTSETDKLRRELQELKDASAQWLQERAQLIENSEHATQQLTESQEVQRLMSAKQVEGEQIRAELAAEREKLRQDVEILQNALAQSEASPRSTEGRPGGMTEASGNTALAVDHDVATAVYHDSELAGEVERLRHDLEHVADYAAQLEAERNRLNADLEEATRPRETSQPSPAADSDSLADSAQTEVTRVEALLEEISHVLNDENTELSIVIRKNAEKAEMESYLKGIRFLISGRS